MAIDTCSAGKGHFATTGCLECTHRFIWNTRSVSQRKEPGVMQSATRPSWFPVIVGASSCLLSLIIYFVASLQSSPIIYFAYLLTPFIPILMMAVAQTRHTTSSSNIYYDLGSGTKILKVSRTIAISGFLIAIPVIVVIAKNFSEI